MIARIICNQFITIFHNKVIILCFDVKIKSKILNSEKNAFYVIIYKKLKKKTNLLRILYIFLKKIKIFKSYDSFLYKNFL